MNELLTIINAECRAGLKTLPEKSVQMVCTSPPYWNLRDYQHKDQIGREKTPALYVATMVSVFTEVWRVLRAPLAATVPWMVAFALRDAGWYLRSEITWCKKVPMPESVLDRPTSATEKIFLLTKAKKYFYDAEAVRNPPSESFTNDSRWKTGSTKNNAKNGHDEALAQNPKGPHRMFDKQRGHSRRHAGFNDRWDKMPRDHQIAYGSNMRNYWVLGPENYSEAHFATFPSEVPKRCIMAGSKPGDTVVDPFFGSGTTGMVALELGRKCIGLELNPDYCELARQRCNVTPGLQLA